jgi:hypothetical protein
MAGIAYLAMGFIWACGEHADPVEDHEASGAVEKALHLDGFVGAGSCQTCQPKTVCRQRLVPCNPPIEVNGRQIMCLEDDCREEMVCTPCGTEGAIDELHGLDLDRLGGPGGFLPIDPSPLRL